MTKKKKSTRQKTVERLPIYTELLPLRRPTTEAERLAPSSSDDDIDPLYENLKEIAAKRKKGGSQ